MKNEKHRYIAQQQDRGSTCSKAMGTHTNLCRALGKVTPAVSDQQLTAEKVSYVCHLNFYFFKKFLLIWTWLLASEISIYPILHHYKKMKFLSSCLANLRPVSIHPEWSQIHGSPWLFLMAHKASVYSGFPCGMCETRVRFLGWKDPLEKAMAPHSSTLAWKIPWTEELCRLPSMGSQRVRHDWATSLHFTLFTSSHFLHPYTFRMRES